jgi:hypothetical protein
VRRRPGSTRARLRLEDRVDRVRRPRHHLLGPLSSPVGSIEDRPCAGKLSLGLDQVLDEMPSSRCLPASPNRSRLHHLGQREQDAQPSP